MTANMKTMANMKMTNWMTSWMTSLMKVMLRVVRHCQEVSTPDYRTPWPTGSAGGDVKSCADVKDYC